MEVAAHKRQLRSRLSASLRARPPSEAAARAVAERIAERPELAAARAVALFASLPDEISTEPLGELVLRRGLRMALPRTLAGARLEFAWVDSFEELRPGRYGVREPAEGSEPAAWSELDWVIVPGLAFDRCGRRLGRGAGYYDRMLAGRTPGAPLVVGVADVSQIVVEVPGESFDERVDAVVTEREWIRVGEDDRPGPEPGRRKASAEEEEERGA